MEHQILRLTDVKAMTGLSSSTIYLRMAEGKFPKKINLGSRAVGWIKTEVNEWIEERIRESRLVEAEIVRIVGVDFDVSSPIPSIKAEAEVELNKIESFSNIDLEKWQEENGFLYDGISFCWSFDGIDSDDLDTCIYEHEGQDIIL